MEGTMVEDPYPESPISARDVHPDNRGTSATLFATRRIKRRVTFSFLLLFLTSIKNASSLLSSTIPQKQQQQQKAPRGPPKVPYIACCSTTEVRRAVDMYVQEGDKVLELGAQLGDISSSLCERIGPSGRATLVDVARKESRSGRTERHPERFVDLDGSYSDRARFLELSRFDEWRGALYDSNSMDVGSSVSLARFDVLLVDVGAMVGNDLLFSVMSLLEEFVAHQQQTMSMPRVIILKSNSLSSLSRRLIHGNKLLKGSATLPSPGYRLEKSSEPHLIATVGVEDYRSTIPMVVNGGDTLLEVGCHFGTTTNVLNKRVTADNHQGVCIGVDIGTKIIQSAQNKYPHIPFAVCDAWHTAELNRLLPQNTQNRGYDVVYADIGGLSGPDGLLESLALLDALGRSLEPRCIVIKSLCMRRLASRLKPFSEIWNNKCKLQTAKITSP